MPPAQEFSDHDLGALAAPIRSIAESAGDAILTVRRRGYDVTKKEDRSLVTDADHAAEAAILPALAKLTPGVPILSEEAVAAGDTPTVGDAPIWVVDPLDGTREFVAGGTEYAVCIGLLVDRVPVFGVLHGPGMGLTYWTAGPGVAMRAKDHTVEQAIHGRPVPEAGPIVITSRFHGKSGRLTAFLESSGMTDRIFMSSALKFGLLAEGSADLYPRFGPTCEWDTAAGHAILTAAGGCVETLDGDELGYGKPDFLNSDFIARGSKA
ncbi:MAG: 3'(2'),5'-bisphosphate nucleotidase CysQ [Alphaproteobacteria bacterium]|nr:3'(2'),5'-bisphosphate nucleotidase CysQ [Alphaproteobacteria bacterium]